MKPKAQGSFRSEHYYRFLVYVLKQLSQGHLHFLTSQSQWGKLMNEYNYSNVTSKYNLISTHK